MANGEPEAASAYRGAPYITRISSIPVVDLAAVFD
jgi:hypothetical protein